MKQCDYCGQPTQRWYCDDDGMVTCPDCHAMFTMGQEQPEYDDVYAEDGNASA